MSIPNLVEAPEIRSYDPSDRVQVHKIVYETGMMGESIEGQWRDYKSWVEINTGYYLDQEPESVLVAVLGRRVVGYLLGCVDSERVPHPAFTGAKAALSRGLLFRPGTAGILWRFLGDPIKDTVQRRADPSDYSFKDPRWPAHFHINFSRDFRGQGLGGVLVDKWLNRLQELEVPGCSLETLTEGVPTPTMAFLQKHGFRPYGTPPMVPGYRTETGNRLYSQVMVQDIPRLHLC